MPISPFTFNQHKLKLKSDEIRRYSVEKTRKNPKAGKDRN